MSGAVPLHSFPCPATVDLGPYHGALTCEAVNPHQKHRCTEWSEDGQRFEVTWFTK